MATERWPFSLAELRDTSPAMSQADIETLRFMYEVMSRGDWDAGFRAIPPDFEYQVSDRDPLAGTYRGRDEVRRWRRKT